MKSLMSIQDRYKQMGIGDLPESALESAFTQAGYIQPGNTERGYRATPENSVKYLYRQMGVESGLRASILDIRHMDRVDGRVKKVHTRMARTAVKSGLKLEMTKADKKIQKKWTDFKKRLRLNRQEKLESDARGLVMEGNMVLQWVINGLNQVAGAVRMPAETIKPLVNEAGRFIDPKSAYEQINVNTGIRIGDPFPLWRLTVVRLNPDSFDDMGSLGRPYMDASRAIWTKLCMTEEDMVIRRRERAPMRTAHVLEGATTTELDEYKLKTEDDQKEVTTNYYLNKKGAVTAVQGDANLDQIKDIGLLLNSFYAGAPAPKGLFGYPDGLNRDILEDLKKDYFDEIDSLQDIQAYAYDLGFRLDLLLAGINPDSYEFQVKFVERKTETPNQAADRALKLQALGASQTTVEETAGLEPAKEEARREDEPDRFNPYPTGEEGSAGPPRVRVTPGNAPKGESATTISTRSK